jgi:hypothetical protein
MRTWPMRGRGSAGLGDRLAGLVEVGLYIGSGEAGLRIGCALRLSRGPTHWPFLG